MKAAAILTLAALSLSAAEINSVSKGNNGLVAHEWGTFTSVAGEDGNPVAWAPLFGAPDLPCFVAHIGTANFTKWAISGLVRMETPVLYFYSQHPTTLSVHVDFPKGFITEWYPNTAVQAFDANTIEWKQVHVVPGKDPEYPATEGASHYYA